MPTRRSDHGCHGCSSSRVLWAFSSLIVQHDQAARIARIQAASTEGICPCLRRVAGCATPPGSAGPASATASLKLTFHLDHSAGANQRRVAHAAIATAVVAAVACSVGAQYGVKVLVDTLAGGLYVGTHARDAWLGFLLLATRCHSTGSATATTNLSRHRTWSIHHG